MKDRISIRQFIFLFIFTTITPLFTYVPQIAARNAGNSGYICAVYYGFLLFLFAALLIRIVKVYPHHSLFDILSEMIGRGITRIIFFLYGVWAFIYLIYKISSYSLLLQSTLMTEGKNYLILFALFFVVIYAAFKGPKTIFRVAELLYGPLIFFLILLAIFTLPNINREFLAPITSQQLSSNLNNIPMLAPIGGNIFFLLFFLRPISSMNRYPVVKKRILQCVFVFFLISYLSIFLTIGIAGATLTSEYGYSLFQAIKCITFLNSFERFDALIVLISVISDFITITFYLIIVMKCFALAFGIKNFKEIAVITLTLACTLSIVYDATQYQLEHIFRGYVDRISMVFQYVIPILLGIICCFKKVPETESVQRE